MPDLETGCSLECSHRLVDVAKAYELELSDGMKGQNHREIRLAPSAENGSRSWAMAVHHVRPCRQIPQHIVGEPAEMEERTRRHAYYRKRQSIICQVGFCRVGCDDGYVVTLPVLFQRQSEHGRREAAFGRGELLSNAHYV
jgi:hypothetical protein